MTTTATPRQSARLTVIAVIAVALAGTLTACGAGANQPDTVRRIGGTSDASTNDDGIELVHPGGPGTPRGAAPATESIDQSDARQVADAVAIASSTVDTRTDTSPMDGLRRASRWLTPDYAAAVARPMPASGGADWIDLARHDGYTTVALTESDETHGGKTTGTTAVLSRIATVTRHAGDGRKLGTERVGVFITLTRPAASAPWRVDSLTTG